jgi:DNA-directed RNA polymerase specialized sigma24 family protein
MAMTPEHAFRLYHAPLTGALARRHPGVDGSTIDDAVAQTWLILARKPIDFLDDTDSPLGWLLTVARHELYALLGRPQPSSLDEREGNVADPAPSIVDVVIARDEWAQVRTQLGTLTRGQRTALTGRALGLTYGQLATSTGHTGTWVNRHTGEGRRALRAALAAA